MPERIAVQLLPDEVESLIRLAERVLDRWQPAPTEPLARAHAALDAALLAHEERPQ
jgi:hypothetical protein